MKKLFFILVLSLHHFLDGASWTSPTTLSEGTANTKPEIAMNEQGYAIAIWEKASSLLSRISSNSGRDWADIITIYNNAANDAQITISENQEAIAIWQNASTFNIQANRSTNSGNSWVDLVTISSGNTSRNPQITINSNGIGMAVWEEIDGANYVIKARRYASGSWGSVVTLSDNSQDAALPQVDINDNDVATAVWQRSDGANTRIESATYSSGSWSGVTILSPAGNNATEPQVKLNNSGDTIATWEIERGAFDIIQTIEGTNGGLSWDPAAVDRSETDSDNRLPSLDLNNNGQAIIIWYKSVPGDILYGIARDATGTWGNIQEIGDPNNSGTLRRKVVLNDNGNTVAAWLNTAEGTLAAWVTTSDAAGAEGTWEDIEYLSDTSHSSTWVNTAIDATGSAIVTWYTNNTVQASNLYRGQDTWQGSAKRLQHPLLLHKNIINVLQWTAVASASYYCVYENSLQNRVYRGEKNVFYHHGRKKDEIITYYVTWTDSSGNESAPISIRI